MSYERMEKGEDSPRKCKRYWPRRHEWTRRKMENTGREAGRRTAERTGAAGEPFEKIREAKAALEQEAREAAESRRCGALKEREKQESERGRKFGGRSPQAPDPQRAKPEPKAQRNFTDPESRIMLDGATKSLSKPITPRRRWTATRK